MNRFQGDPAIFISKNGAALKFQGGQPVMDQGLYNAVLISLFTRRGWWANALGLDCGSDYEKTLAKPVTRSSLADIENAAERALAWMKKQRHASRITVSSRNTTGMQIETEIMIQPPTGDPVKFLATRQGLVWLGQINNPVEA